MQSRRFDSTIARISQAGYQELFPEVLEKLPRELRDEVYTYLVILDEQPIVIDLADLSAPSVISNDHNAHASCGRIHPSPIQTNNHLFLPDQVGFKAATELLEGYYANNAFDISVYPYSAYAARAWQIQHILHGWNGIKHPLGKTKKLHIRLRCEDLDKKTCLGGDAERGRAERAIREYMDMTHSWLGPFVATILTKGRNPEMEVEVSLHTAFAFECDSDLYDGVELEPSEHKMWLQEESCFWNMLDAIRGEVLELIRGGVAVKVTHRDQMGIVPRGRDLTPFLPPQGKEYEVHQYQVRAGAKDMIGPVARLQSPLGIRSRRRRLRSQVADAFTPTLEHALRTAVGPY
jgi:hypothetical protein